MPTNRCSVCGRLLQGTKYPHPETGEDTCPECHEQSSSDYAQARFDQLTA